ncbi:hypothetical protein [Listeria grandensis]|uniref:hypothetical protein n=1 Tax=Listeria grandensis TaxID=1494963 RepID=UPI0004BC8C05|nr:hypothetical protein [Listeria grandensis]
MESYYLFSNGELKRKDNVVRLTAPDGKFKDLKVEMTREIFSVWGSGFKYEMFELYRPTWNPGAYF